MQELDTSVESGEQLHRPHDQSERPNTKRTALPKFQLFIVFLIQFAEPVTATVIYPFVNQFVRETGVTGGDERETGYFAGIIVSTNCTNHINMAFNTIDRNLHFSLLKHSPSSIGVGRQIAMAADPSFYLALLAYRLPCLVSDYRIPSGYSSPLDAFRVLSMAISVRTQAFLSFRSCSKHPSLYSRSVQEYYGGGMSQIKVDKTRRYYLADHRFIEYRGRICINAIDVELWCDHWVCLFLSTRLDASLM